MSLTLTVKEAAQELAAAPVAVLRLICLGILPATQLSNGWRITADNLQNYVGRGAPRLTMPEVTRAG
ncbi:MAG: helix-turn-helix domain-containing protein [Planctomycetaceae bacterium]